MSAFDDVVNKLKNDIIFKKEEVIYKGKTYKCNTSDFKGKILHNYEYVSLYNEVDKIYSLNIKNHIDGNKFLDDKTLDLLYDKIVDNSTTDIKVIHLMKNSGDFMIKKDISSYMVKCENI